LAVGSGLHMFDISNREQIAEVGSIELDLAVSSALLADEHYAYIIREGWDHIVLDISNPAAISQIGTLPILKMMVWFKGIVRPLSLPWS